MPAPIVIHSPNGGLKPYTRPCVLGGIFTTINYPDQEDLDDTMSCNMAFSDGIYSSFVCNFNNPVTVGQFTKFYYSTDDGVTWLIANQPTLDTGDQPIGAYAFNNSGNATEFVISGINVDSGSNILGEFYLHSTDGINWTKSPYVTLTEPQTAIGVNTPARNDLPYDSGGKWFAGGLAALETSTDGLTWTRIDHPYDQSHWASFSPAIIGMDLGNFAYGNGLFMTGGDIELDDGSGLFSAFIYRSADNGATWTSSTINGLNNALDVDENFIAYLQNDGSTNWIGVTGNGTLLVRSTDNGLTFSRLEPAGLDILGGIASINYFLDSWWIVGFINSPDSTAVFKSPDGTIWTRITGNIVSNFEVGYLAWNQRTGINATLCSNSLISTDFGSTFLPIISRSHCSS